MKTGKYSSLSTRSLCESRAQTSLGISPLPPRDLFQRKSVFCEVQLSPFAGESGENVTISKTLDTFYNRATSSKENVSAFLIVRNSSFTIFNRLKATHGLLVPAHVVLICSRFYVQLIKSETESRELNVLTQILQISSKFRRQINTGTLVTKPSPTFSVSMGTISVTILFFDGLINQKLLVYL